MNFELAREKMVDCQVRPNDVTDHRLLEAMLSVPREEFVNEADRELAYLDRDVAISGASEGAARYMMSSGPLSKLLQLLAPKDDDVALVVGTGNGYATAVLSMLVSSVVGIDEDEKLVKASSDNLSRLGYDNVAVLSGALEEGCEREAPYDAILVEGAVEMVPQALQDQLSENGRLVAVIGTGNSAQATIFQNNEGIIGRREIFNCSIPQLPGFQQPAEFTF